MAGKVTFNREGKAKCLFATVMNGAHEWAWQDRKKQYHCTNGNCKGTKKADPPKVEGVIQIGLMDRMLGRGHGTLKGGKIGNKADKAAAEAWRKAHGGK